MSVMPGVDAPTRTSVPLTNEFPLARVDLLPPEVLAGRKFRKARGWMAAVVVGTVALTGGVFALASADADAAAEELATEQARTTQLRAEESQYAAVPAILASVDRAETALDTAMASDIQWFGYLSQMASVAPEGLWFTSISLSAAPTDAAVGSDPLAPVDAVGDVVTIGRALAYDDVATWMDALGAVTGYDHVLFSTAVLDTETGDSPYVDFQVSVKVLPVAYSDRYVSEAE